MGYIYDIGTYLYRNFAYFRSDYLGTARATCKAKKRDQNAQGLGFYIIFMMFES